MEHLRALKQEIAMTEKAFAQADADWLELIAGARSWFSGPLGGLMLFEEQRLL
jgi:hypothetical protein